MMTGPAQTGGPRDAQKTGAEPVTLPAAENPAPQRTKARRRTGRRRLKSGFARMFGKHDGWTGRAYNRACVDLAEQFDLCSRFLVFEASRVAALRVQLELATRALEAARREREAGKGRRPGNRDLERLARRSGLQDASYSQALDRLRDIAGPRRRASGIAAALATQREVAAPGKSRRDV